MAFKLFICLKAINGVHLLLKILLEKSSKKSRGDF